MRRGKHLRSQRSPAPGPQWGTPSAGACGVARIGRNESMAEQVRFAAQKRTALGKAASKLRRQGIIPANIVVQGRESIAVQVNGLELGRFLAKHSATTLLRLTLGGGAGDE